MRCGAAPESGLGPTLQLTAWDVVTELLIPAVGAFGAIAIAVVAVWQTARAGRLDREQRARQVRAEFARVVDAYLDPQPESLTRGKLAEVMERREHELHLAAAAAGEDADRIASWIIRTDSQLVEQHAVASFGSDRDPQELEWERFSFRWEVGARVRSWVLTGDMDLSPVELQAGDAAAL